jgi:hypothetical protein
MARASCMLTLALVLAACGGDDDSSSPDAAAAPDAEAPDARPDPTLEDVCGPDGVLARMFDVLVQCNPAFDTVLLQGRATPEAIADFCESLVGPYIEDGSILLPGWGSLEGCQTTYAHIECTDGELEINTADCDLFRGAQLDGEDCEISEQCSRDSFCDRSGGGACGLCAAKLADGMTCNADEQCVNGGCIGTQCGRLGFDNDPCVISPAPGADPNEDCRGQRECDPDTNRCVSPRTWVLNDVCEPKLLDCDSFDTGLYCKPSPGGGGQCAPMIELGAACRINGTGQGLCDLRNYETCPAGTNANCSAPTIVTVEGEACSFQSGRKCAAGMMCTNPFGAGTCVDLQAEDEVCQPAGQGTDTEHCDLFLNCLGGTCEYGAYSGTCP